MRTVGILALGCKTNQYDAQAMRERFMQAGYTPASFEEVCDVYVVATCMVTGTGENKSLKFIRQAVRRNPSAAIVVAGCLAQREGEALFLPGVRLVLGNARRGEVVELLEDALRRDVAVCAVENLTDAPFEALAVTANEGRSRAVLKIQEGCENYCAYCIIPLVRGTIRSRPLEQVELEARRLAAAGYGEIVLTGIHLASYGRDLPPLPEAGRPADLPDAAAAVCRQEGVRRVRLGSLEPGWVDETYARRLAELPQLCPQFHLSLQSGCDRVLARMRRKYDTGRFRQAVNALRANFAGCAITTDVICGFPGESEADFTQTVEFCREMGFARMHVFPYSEREGTDAARLDGAVPIPEREARARQLISVGRALEADYVRSQVGKRREVLVEERGEGYTREYVRVKLNEGRPGEILAATITRCQGNLAWGQTEKEE